MNTTHKTAYPNIVYRIGKHFHDKRKTEKHYYGRFRDKQGKQTDVALGWQYRDDMTPARANKLLAEYKMGKRKTKKQLKAEDKEKAKYSLEALAEQFFDSVDNNGIRQRDKVIYESDLPKMKKYLLPMLGDIPPDIYTTKTIDEFRDTIFKEYPELAPATVKHILALLRRILNHAGLLHLKYNMPKVDNETTEDLSPEQLKSLLTVLHSTEVKVKRKDGKIYPHVINRQVADMMLLIMCTGMRQGEVRKLKWKDINFSRKTYVIKKPKGGKSFTNPLSTSAVQILKRQMASKVIPHPEAYVFPGKVEGRRCSISRRARIIADLAGLSKDFRPCHGLRHWFLSDCAERGVDIVTLASLAGHKSFEMTKRYTQARDKNKQAAVDAISDLISINR